jgi:hypothetical protein
MPVEDSNHADAMTARVLQGLLTQAVPVDRMAAQMLPEMLDRLRRDLLPLTGKTFRDALLDPTVSVAALTQIKDYGKKLATEPTASAAEHETAMTIYFAAIASSLVFHGQKISSHPYETLTRSFTVLTEKPWLPPELASLFQRACILCREMK